MDCLEELRSGPAGTKGPSRHISRRDRPRPYSRRRKTKPQSQLIYLLDETINFWSLLLNQNASPLKRNIDLTPSDSTKKLLTELSSLLPDMKQCQFLVPEAKSENGNNWIKQKLVMQNEFARLVIWKSDFSSMDMTLLLSENSPLRRMIAETLLSITEMLLSLLREDGDGTPIDHSLWDAATLLKEKVVQGRSITWDNSPESTSPIPYDAKGNLNDSGYGVSLSLGEISGELDDDGDSVMTDMTQITTGSNVDFGHLSEIEKLRHDINSLQDLEISMRRVLPSLRLLPSPGCSPRPLRRTSTS